MACQGCAVIIVLCECADFIHSIFDVAGMAVDFLGGTARFASFRTQWGKMPQKEHSQGVRLKFGGAVYVGMCRFALGGLWIPTFFLFHEKNYLHYTANGCIIMERFHLVLLGSI